MSSQRACALSQQKNIHYLCHTYLLALMMFQLLKDKRNRLVEPIDKTA